jgi:hypothetical protein
MHFYKHVCVHEKSSSISDMLWQSNIALATAQVDTDASTYYYDTIHYNIIMLFLRTSTAKAQTTSSLCVITAVAYYLSSVNPASDSVSLSNL